MPTISTVYPELVNTDRRRLKKNSETVCSDTQIHIGQIMWLFKDLLMSHYPSAEEETGLYGESEQARKRGKSHLCTRCPQDTVIFNDKIKIHWRSFDSNTQNRFMLAKKEHKLINSFIRRATSCWCQRQLLKLSVTHTHTSHRISRGKKEPRLFQSLCPEFRLSGLSCRLRGVNCRLRDQTEGVKVQSSKILSGHAQNHQTRFWRLERQSGV